ncbi:MAG: hypothetical protein DRO67_04875 [Candidatus Asgardarchaeum californiense]|nr:MAG: hypothetical protein DRO67_04875 [Candidatus Asgardarchaeum californiense]
MSDFPVKNCFGGVDEQVSQDIFEEECGSVKKAMRLQYLWNNSYPMGTQYDKTFKTGRYRSKGEVFVKKAMAEGYTEKQIDMFLSL